MSIACAQTSHISFAGEVCTQANVPMADGDLLDLALTEPDLT